MTSHDEGPYSGPHCFSCGRPFELKHRRGGEGNIVKYCSKGCRSKKLEKNRELEESLFLMVSECAPKSICPSDFARAYFDEESWRDQMEVIRCAARRLAQAGKIIVTQKGMEVSSLNFRGPIRLQLKN